MCISDPGALGSARLMDKAGRVAVQAILLGLLAACGAPESPTAEAGSQPAALASAGLPLTASAAAAPAKGEAAGSRLLGNPDDLQMVLLAYRLLGQPPPLADWAAAQYPVQSANEFERAVVLQREQQRLQAVYDSTDGVGRLRLQVSASLSEYDAGRGGYYLDAFAPGSLFTFATRPDSRREEKVSLSVDNDGELNFWPLDASAAQQALQKNGGNRQVTLDSQFLITGAMQRSDGPVIAARLQRYAIVGSRYGEPSLLGERVIEP